ncbi:MAG: endolytic transglycosylase MltG [Deltaproteobacteria bacterium]|nr:endolytic transglycosylase MltG [Deltaproteobacteria bacterium]
MVTATAAGIWAARDLSRYWNTPANKNHINSIRFPVERGEPFAKITARLAGIGLISHKLKFKIMARYYGLDTKIRAGEYLLFPGMTPKKILDRLTSGDVMLHRVTIPEGFTIFQTAERVEKAGLCTAKAFLKIARDPLFAKRMEISADTVEGYLFPDTYLFEQNPGPEKIVTTMIQRFTSVFSDKWEKQAHDMEMTVLQIVTLASIIEKETAVGSERPVISSVFYNRLKRHMRLASDPTVIYGIKEFNGNLTKKDLERKTPYNTYVIYGLPPGPIANPGRASLKAALFPATTDYLYFVAMPGGSHYFSTTLSEHNRAVRKYQKHHRRRSTRE